MGRRTGKANASPAAQVYLRFSVTVTAILKLLPTINYLKKLNYSHNMTVNQRNELSRLEDRIARLEAHTGIEDSPQH